VNKIGQNMDKERPIPPMIYARVLRAVTAASAGTEPATASQEHIERDLTRLSNALEKEFSVFLIRMRAEELAQIKSVLELAQLISEKIGA
jgi:hypothetical protein